MIQNAAVERDLCALESSALPNVAKLLKDKRPNDSADSNTKINIQSLVKPHPSVLNMQKRSQEREERRKEVQRAKEQRREEQERQKQLRREEKWAFYGGILTFFGCTQEVNYSFNNYQQWLKSAVRNHDMKIVLFHNHLPCKNVENLCILLMRELSNDLLQNFYKRAFVLIIALELNPSVKPRTAVKWKWRRKKQKSSESERKKMQIDG